MEVSKATPSTENYRPLNARDVLMPLVKTGVLSTPLAQKLVKQWSETKEHPLSLLSDVQIPNPDAPGKPYSYDHLAGIVARSFGLEYVRIDTLKVDLDILSGILPFPYMDRLRIVPIAQTDEKVTFVTADPLSVGWVSEVRGQVKRKVELKLGSPRQIKHLLNEIFVVQRAMKEVTKEQGKVGQEKLKLLREGRIAELDDLLEKSRGRVLTVQDSHVVKIVDWLLNFAVMERASDIHLEPRRGLGHVRFRVDGDLRTVYRLDYDMLVMIISRFKILGDMKLDERRRPQDGGIKRTLENGMRLQMRLSTLPVGHGEKMVVRIFDKNVSGNDLSFIGFNPKDQQMWEWMINRPQGLILVTGPTGSGKTTTLYTSLNKVATPEVNVCTAEDPIEMEIDNFNQVQVNPAVGMGFAECIRSFLRQDPDIIMVGEIRDRETGDMAIQSSLTGHLVFSTLHTNGALATIQRLVDLGLQTFLINSSLVGILAQRLVRKLCPHCKHEVATDPSRWAAMVEGDDIPMPGRVFEARGCEECKGTGYLGRACVYELVKYDEKIRNVVHAKVEINELREKAKGLFTPMHANGAKLVAKGETTIDEILKIAY